MFSFTLNSNFWNAVISIVVYEFIYLPLAVYYSRRYRQYRHHVVLNSRCARLTLWEANIAITKFIYSPLEQIAFYIWGASSFITRSVTLCGIYLMVYYYSIMVWRIWLLYYDLRWTTIIQGMIAESCLLCCL